MLIDKMSVTQMRKVLETSVFLYKIECSLFFHFPHAGISCSFVACVTPF